MNNLQRFSKDEQLIGIMGGTFDPIHYGHTEIALHCLHYFGLDKVLFIPSGAPPHKKDKKVESAEHRYNMVKLATEGLDKIEVDSMEKDRNGYTYTIDSLLQLKERYKKASFYYIIGADTLNEIHIWKSLDEVVKLTKFLVVGRNSIEPTLLHIAAARAREDFGAQLLDACYVGLNISSSQIRQNISDGKSISGLVHPQVEEYIIKNGLYRE